MKRIILHIGPHKTGSTFVQEVLDAHPEALAAQGVVRPDLWRGPASRCSQYELPARIRQRDPGLGPEWDAVLAGPAGTVLVSSEDLALLDEADLAFLAGMLAGCAVQILYVWREPAALLRANWQEGVRHGRVEGFAASVAMRMLDFEHDPILNPCRVLAPYAAVFGRAAIRILSYPDLAGAGFADAVLAAAGLRPLGVVARPVHASPSMALSEVARALVQISHRHIPRPAGLPGCMADALTADHGTLKDTALRLAEAETATLSLALAGPRFDALRRRMVAEFGAPIAPNARFAAAADGPMALRYPDPGWLLDPEAVPVLHALFARLCAPRPERAPRGARALARRLGLAGLVAGWGRDG